jgi:hypothetical protein
LRNYEKLLEQIKNKNGQAVAGDQRPDKLADEANHDDGGASKNE